MTAKTYPLWTQDQSIAYEAALEAINDVIAGYILQDRIEGFRLLFPVQNQPVIPSENIEIPEAGFCFGRV